MKSFPSEDHATKQRGLAGQWANRTLAAGGLFILAATLFPFQFFPQDISSRRSAAFLHWLSTDLASFQDFGENILLFVPFGFGLACFVCQKRRGTIPTFITAVLAGACASFFGELLQVFLPTRDPSWRDVASNTTGSVMGSVCFQLLAGSILHSLSDLEAKIEELLPLRRATAAFLCYAALGILISVSLQRATSLSTWDPAYPLFLGNDPTGTRPWQGRIFEMEIASRAISARRAMEIATNRLPLSMDDGAVASYRPSGNLEFRDATGSSPEFSWNSQPALGLPQKELVLTGQAWLGSRIPAAKIAESARRTNQFTVRVVCAAALRNEAPFGRIVSFSQDSDHLNFILSQKKQNLVFGFRTPLTGEEGEPALIAPNVFATTDRRDILLTYDGSTLRLYLNGKQDAHSLRLSPGAVFFHPFFRLRMFDLRGYAVVYETFLFVPLGVLLAIVSRSMNYGSLGNKALLLVGAIFPASLLEIALAGVRRNSFDMTNLLLGICLTLGAVAFCHLDGNRIS